MIAIDFIACYNIYEILYEGGIYMSNTLVQFRAEETARLKAVNICEKLGIDLPTYLRMCMSRLIQENGIPFSMKIESDSDTLGLSAMKALQRRTVFLKCRWMKSMRKSQQSESENIQ